MCQIVLLIVEHSGRSEANYWENGTY